MADFTEKVKELVDQRVALEAKLQNETGKLSDAAVRKYDDSYASLQRQLAALFREGTVVRPARHHTARGIVEKNLDALFRWKIEFNCLGAAIGESDADWQLTNFGKFDWFLRNFGGENQAAQFRIFVLRNFFRRAERVHDPAEPIALLLRARIRDRAEENECRTKKR